MVPNPFQGAALVEETDVEVSVVANLVAGKETKQANPVVEVDEDHVLVFGNDLRAIPVPACQRGVACGLSVIV